MCLMTLDPTKRNLPLLLAEASFGKTFVHGMGGVLADKPIRGSPNLSSAAHIRFLLDLAMQFAGRRRTWCFGEIIISWFSVALFFFLCLGAWIFFFCFPPLSLAVVFDYQKHGVAIWLFSFSPWKGKNLDEFYAWGFDRAWKWK